jgi:hypothetical protein
MLMSNLLYAHVIGADFFGQFRFPLTSRLK